MKTDYELVPGGLTIAQISAMTALVRGAHTDEGARVPEGTMASLVALGFAYKNYEAYWPMNITIQHVREWEKVSARGSKISPTVVKSKTTVRQVAVKPTKILMDDMRVLSVVGATNPSRVGTKAYEFYELIRASDTVADYYRLGGNKAYLEDFIKRGVAKIG